MIHYDTPTLVRYGSKWVYHFPTPSRLTSRCPRVNTWSIGTQTLEGAGLVENATECELTTDGLRTIPELHGAARFNMKTPVIFPPLDVPIIDAHELPDVKAALTSGIGELERLRDNVQASQKTLEVDTLMHVSNKLQLQTVTSYWPTTAAATIGSLLVIVILCLVIREAPRCPVRRRPSKQPETRDAILLQEIAVNNTSDEPQQDSTVYTYTATR
jgi:hypothetical protein